MPTIDLTDAEHAAITALIRRAVEQGRLPREGGAQAAAGGQKRQVAVSQTHRHPMWLL
jgi:hypothetical protein